jgi:hypothetical protein
MYGTATHVSDVKALRVDGMVPDSLFESRTRYLQESHSARQH